jgi:hypothetical protein
LYFPTNLDKGYLEKYGLAPEDFANDIPTIWEESYQSFIVFSAMSTQWRIGMSGATGLDYCALREIWQRLKIPLSNRDEVFSDLQVMESEVLELMRKERKA